MICPTCNNERVEELAFELIDIRAKRDRYRAALEVIANQDYRGNEPASSRLAREALALSREVRRGD